MSEDFKNGLLVAGVGVILFLLYREMNNKKDVVIVSKDEKTPEPISIPLPANK
jgi:hypothetical protein